ETSARSLGEIVDGADILLGLSAGGVVSQEMVAKMAPRPLILALANPEPEIRPEAARAVRPDCVIATGRSDYPNQVNNVLCFPFIFRGALDVGATAINDPMKLAATRAIAALAEAESSDVVRIAYAEGEDERVLRAAQIVVDEKLGRPILVGDAAVIAERRREFGLRFEIGRDVEIVPAGTRHPTRLAARLVRDGRADGLLCGT